MTSAPRWYLPALLLALALLPSPARAQTSAAAAWSASPAAQLKSALRELVAAQARYRETRGGYARTVAPLRLPAESGVRLEVTAASAGGKLGDERVTLRQNLPVALAQPRTRRPARRRIAIEVGAALAGRTLDQGQPIRRENRDRRALPDQFRRFCRISVE